jgi:hydroxymethylpyrimidine pyrophosphatase-like HAD family hydrolase
MAVIAIDWDHTLMDGKEWLPGAQKALNRLREEGHKIIIHSCNNDNWILKNLQEVGIPVDGVWKEDGKPIADLYIDDNGYHFPYNGDWAGEIDKILERVKGLDNRKW